MFRKEIKKARSEGDLKRGEERSKSAGKCREMKNGE